MKKVIVSIVMAVVLVLSLGLMAGCGSSYGETYTGTVSEQTYDSKDDAVKGFLATEVSGVSLTAVYVGAEEKKTYTVEEAAEVITLSEEDSEGLESVQEIEVEYTEQAGSASQNSLLAAQAETKTIKRVVFVLRYTDGGYKYYSPVVIEGEALTASYFDSVFAPEKYLNCTMELSGSAKVNAMGQSQKVKMSGVAKCTESAYYEKSTSEGFTFEGYMIDTSKGLYQATRLPGDTTWDVSPLDLGFGGSMQIETVSEYLIFAFDMQFGGFDHTCFEKTKKGYALREGMGGAYLSKALENMGFDSSDIMDGVSFNMPKYEIIINDGRVEELSMKFSLNISSYGVSVSETVEETVTFKNFGTTKVDIPADIKAKLPL